MVDASPPADIETSSDDYAKRFQGEIGKWFLDIQAQATLSMLTDFPGASVLDVGGGHGQLTKPLLDQGHQVTVLGSDQSCQKRIKEYVEKKQCSFKVGDYLQIPFEEKSFDIVLSFRLIAHAEEWPLLIAQLTRIARKAVIIDYPSWKSANILTPMTFALKKKVEKNTRPYLLFFERDLCSKFHQQNFRLEKRYPEFFLPMALHRALQSPGFSRSTEAFFRIVGCTKFFGSPIILKFIR